ncbi:MAG: ice-binding family protein [Natronospirillum sp.]
MIDDNTTVIASLAVTSSAPANTATAVGTNTKVVAVFNRTMQSDTITQTSFTLQAAGETAVVGDVSYDADTQSATLEPGSALTASTVYTATVTTAVKDDTGVALLADYVWSFTTGASTDTTAPTVSSNSPADTATGVLRNTKVSVVFNEAIDPVTLTSTSFQLTKDSDGSVVSGDLLYVNPTTVVFTPAAILDNTVNYTLTLSTALTDIAGNQLDGNQLDGTYVIGFETGADVSSSPATVDLGTAGNYVILAKTGISTTGTTHITGDIAVSPESRTAITGFSETLSTDGTLATSSLVTGNLYSADMASPTPTQLTTAVTDMQAAYADAAGRLTPDFTELGAGEIGGLTLDPGLYKWGTGVLVTSDVTLDGSATDRWIFQIGQDLKLEDGKKIVLTGGALPENIFWQVAGEVTLQAGTTFNGIILTQTQVVFKSGAVLNGRALAQTAVTLISNDVNEPAQ